MASREDAVVESTWRRSGTPPGDRPRAKGTAVSDTDTEIPSRFLETLRPHLPYAGGGDLTAADDLAALGLDSMGVVRLLVDLEENYELDLPDELLTEETFSTVGSLWATLSRLVGADKLVGAERSGGE